VKYVAFLEVGPSMRHITPKDQTIVRLVVTGEHRAIHVGNCSICGHIINAENAEPEPEEP